MERLNAVQENERSYILKEFKTQLPCQSLDGPVVNFALVGKSKTIVDEVRRSIVALCVGINFGHVALFSGFQIGLLRNFFYDF